MRTANQRARVAAVAFAAVLYKVVRSPAVSAALTDMIQSALHAI